MTTRTSSTVELTRTTYSAPDAARLIAALSQDMVARYGPDEELSQPADPTAFTAPSGVFLVATVGAVPAACAGVRPLNYPLPEGTTTPRVRIAELKRMYVAKGFRGQGLARRLLAVIEAFAVRAGYTELWLESGIEQPEALGLYTSAGYQPMERYGEYARSPLSRCLAKVLDPDRLAEVAVPPLPGDVVDDEPTPTDPDVPDAAGRRIADPGGPWAPLPATSTAEARARRTLALGGPMPRIDRVADLGIAGPVGPVGLRAYQADVKATGRPLLLWFHGGGWSGGGLDSHDTLCRHLTRATGGPVLAADYRLAPAAPFPAAVSDARAVTDWALSHAADLGGDPAKVVVAGDSAGGNLAAVVARHADPGALAGQVLVYPVVDAAMEWDSVRRFATGHGFTAEDLRACWDAYVPDPALRVDPDASPLRAFDLRGVAPALVLVAACDVLRDQGVAYAEALRAAGVRTKLLTANNQLHGFLGWTGVTDAAHRTIGAIGRQVASLLD